MSLPLMHQSRFTRSALGLAFGFAAISLLAATADASVRAVSGASRVVNYADLDLSRQADAAKLYARLKRASQQVCRNDDPRQLLMQRQSESCYDKALEEAVEKVNRSALTALHAAQPRLRLARGS